jgi:hypothetical protein
LLKRAFIDNEYSIAVFTLFVDDLPLDELLLLEIVKELGNRGFRPVLEVWAVV